ncbi:MAG: hypothetical protein V4681_03605 [Patescibacteria group bacterium]
MQSTDHGDVPKAFLYIILAVGAAGFVAFVLPPIKEMCLSKASDFNEQLVEFTSYPAKR